MVKEFSCQTVQYSRNTEASKKNPMPDYHGHTHSEREFIELTLYLCILTY